MRGLHNMKLVIETPDDYHHQSIQTYIDTEIKRPSKRWIEHVITGKQESEFVKINHEKYLLLPDTERINRYWSLVSYGKKRQLGGGSSNASNNITTLTRENSNSSSTSKEAITVYFQKPGKREYVILNWLAIIKEPDLRTIRDLTQEHLQLLKQIRKECLDAIHEETKIPRDEVMMYVHYHPSVYQFHIHFAYPYMQYNHKDVYRMHSLNTIIHNLEQDGDYYKKAHLQVSVPKDSVIYKTIRKNTGCN